MTAGDDAITALLREVAVPTVRPDLLARVTDRRRRALLARRSMAVVAAGVAGMLALVIVPWRGGHTGSLAGSPLSVRAEVAMTAIPHTGKPYRVFEGIADYPQRAFQGSAAGALTIQLGDDTYQRVDPVAMNGPISAAHGATWVHSKVSGPVTWKNLAPARLDPTTMLDDVRAVGVPLTADPLPYVVGGVRTTRWSGPVTRAQAHHDPLFDADRIELYVDADRVTRRAVYTLTDANPAFGHDTYRLDVTDLNRPVSISAPPARAVIEAGQLRRNLTDIACAQAHQFSPDGGTTPASKAAIAQACTLGSTPDAFAYASSG